MDKETILQLRDTAKDNSGYFSRKVFDIILNYIYQPLCNEVTCLKNLT